MAKPVSRDTAPAHRRNTPITASDVREAIQEYAEHHPQDDAGRVVLDRLAADPDQRVSKAIAAIGRKHSEDLIHAIIVAVKRASELKILPDRFSAALKLLEKTAAAVAVIKEFPNEFGIFPKSRTGFGDPNGDHAQFLQDVRTVIPRMAKHLKDLRDIEAEVFKMLRISRKRRKETSRELAALQILIEAVRRITRKPHERPCAALIEAALEIEEIPADRVRYAARISAHR